MVKNIKFINVCNNFQSPLTTDVTKINKSSNLFVPADKSNNLYELSADSYKKLLKENVTASYQKTATSTLDRINAEANPIAHNQKLEDRIESFPLRDAFIRLKDQKENFRNHPKYRLINPAKSEIGKISKHLLDTINVFLRKQSGLNQWRNTASTLSWFNTISDELNCRFLMFDVVEFYPSITEKLRTDAINFANDCVNINDEAISTIMHARKSLLFCESSKGFIYICYIYIFFFFLCNAMGLILLA